MLVWTFWLGGVLSKFEQANFDNLQLRDDDELHSMDDIGLELTHDDSGQRGSGSI